MDMMMMMMTDSFFDHGPLEAVPRVSSTVTTIPCSSTVTTSATYVFVYSYNNDQQYCDIYPVPSYMVCHCDREAAQIRLFMD